LIKHTCEGDIGIDWKTILLMGGGALTGAIIGGPIGGIAGEAIGLGLGSFAGYFFDKYAEPGKYKSTCKTEKTSKIFYK